MPFNLFDVSIHAMRVQMSDENPHHAIDGQGELSRSHDAQRLFLQAQMPPRMGLCTMPRSRRGSKPTTRDAADEMWSGLRRPANRVQCARALHNLPEPAGSLTSGEPLGPTKEELERQCGRPPRSRMLCGRRRKVRLAGARCLLRRRALDVFERVPPRGKATHGTHIALASK